MGKTNFRLIFNFFYDQIKDIIFIITQHEQLGMQAWLEAYHKISCGYGHKVLDQGPLPTMLAKLIAKAQLLSWLMYLIGVFFIFLMPHPEYSHKTYFSENALLPGLVRLEFDIEHIAKQYLSKLKD